jgi:carboxypeptidase Q
VRLRIVLLLVALVAPLAVGQPGPSPSPRSVEKFDSTAVARIIDEGMNRSQVMDLLSWLTDVCGARLTASPGYKKAADWARATMTGWGLANAHFEKWGPWGHGWSIKRYSAQVIEPMPFPLISYPKAWSPGTSGSLRGEAIYVDAKTDSSLETYRGKLDGKFVMLDDPRQLKAHFQPDAERLSDSALLALANADPDRPRRRGRFGPNSDFRRVMLLENKKLQFCMDEGAAALLSCSRGDDGTVFVQSASFPANMDVPRDKRPHVYDLKTPEMLPQFVLAAEHYNRIVRMLKKGVNVKLEVTLEVLDTREDSVANVIAEIPGTDLKDEIVMIGGHLDSWHAGTGATDDGTGVVVCMEAMRILKALGLKPRRTIRVGLWAAEEEGLLGSAAYVRQHFGERKAPADSLEPKTILKPEAEKFSVYFNNDNGTGKVRGIYMQGSEMLRPLFRAWLTPFRAMGASTVSPANTGGTDHLSFNDIGLPGFQFIQDDIDYDIRTWHSNMDVYDRAQEDDLKEAASVMAAFAYNAAMRDEKFPRKGQ